MALKLTNTIRCLSQNFQQPASLIQSLTSRFIGSKPTENLTELPLNLEPENITATKPESVIAIKPEEIMTSTTTTSTTKLQDAPVAPLLAAVKVSQNIVRNYAQANDEKKYEKCTKVPIKCKRKRPCGLSGGKCPKLQMPNCECKVVHECERHYRKAKCHKISSPYPSYSESCAETLDPDPSECVQCPWPRCPVKLPKKKFHTMAGTLDQHAGFHTHSSVLFHTEEFLCDAHKEPCKPPLPRCPPGTTKREKDEKARQEEKERKAKKKQKIQQNMKSRSLDGLVQALQSSLFDLALPVIQAKIKQDKRPKFPFDEREAEYKRESNCRREKVSKWPNCGKKPKQPKIIDCPPEPTCPKENLVGVILASAMPSAASMMDAAAAIELQKKRCPQIKPKYPHVDRSTDVMVWLESGKKSDNEHKERFYKDNEDACGEKEEEFVDPCPPPQKKTRDVCPKDLLKKRPKKGRDL